MSEEKKYPDHPVGNCQKCANTFGGFGCYDTVNNELRYYCEEGQKKWETLHEMKRLNAVTLTRDEAEVLYNHLDASILNEIHDSGEDYDNMAYLATLCGIYMRCKEAADEAAKEQREAEK